MMEHLDEDEAQRFLQEAYRVIAPGGRIRLALPDLRIQAEDYIRQGDADAFMRGSLLGTRRPRGLFEWARWILMGPRHHLWMYDGPSLRAHLIHNGFDEAVVLPAGDTTIDDPGPLNLREAEGYSVYVEAVRP